MANKVKLEVITPSKVFFEGTVDIVTVTTTEGSEGFMAGHSWATKLLDVGELHIKNDDEEKTAAISGGFIDVKESIVIFTDAAEWDKDIDMERALSTKATIEDWIKTRTEYSDPKELARAEIELAKCINRMKVGSGSRKA